MQQVEWAEFELQELFEIKISKGVDKGGIQLSDNSQDYHFIGRTSVNYGIQGFVEKLGFEPNPKNTFSVVQIGEIVAQFRQREWYASQNIFILYPQIEEIIKNYNFFVSSINSTLKVYDGGYSNYPTLGKLKNQKISIPIKPNAVLDKLAQIDFDFMENFLSQLEAYRLSQLEAYLLVTGLKDYTLTTAEQQALADFEEGKVVWGEYRFADIFNNIQQGRRLKKDDQVAGDIPFVMAGITNTGVVNYISNPVATFPRNSITIDIFGNAFYRSYDFGAGDDTGVYWNDESELSKGMMLFLTKSSEKALAGKFSYGKKLRSSQSLNFKMQLPSYNQQPDYSFMETLISAIQKLVIKDVVHYADSKIAATKQVINR
ncbi:MULTISPECIES: restriction endonuclease subunit S [unclassified Pasteurella]|uniref:restriction endonuclease subunit S n=1 Tax=unclassified Pasteurella TaxID=2621516 RepID=UPI001073B4EE|nr:restriction endonuclease subunit S [Pasteurella sp. 19428wF3_WM03]TFU53178.1 restriction endonuclease subunit S [Pasteurella sp. WM03]